MREYRDGKGARRLWFRPGEIDDLMVEALSDSGHLPSSEEQDLSVDIEDFIESHLELQLDLGAPLGPEVLGVTEFVPGRRPKISINRDLTGSALEDEDSTPGLVGRWRATIAHEAAHVLLHERLFERDTRQIDLFETPREPCASCREQLMRCLKRDVGFKQTTVSDWREVQANMGMAALLMPKPIFLEALTLEKARLRSLTPRRDLQGIESLVARLATRFTVSKQASRIRLMTLLGIQSPDQLTL